MPPFGKVLRQYRTDNNISLPQMAPRLLMAQSFLSNIETGKARVPDDFLDKLLKYYPDLAPQRERFEVLIHMQRKHIYMPLTEGTFEEAELATLISKKFSSISEEKKEQLRALLA